MSDFATPSLFSTAFLGRYRPLRRLLTSAVLLFCLPATQADVLTSTTFNDFNSWSAASATATGASAAYTWEAAGTVDVLQGFNDAEPTYSPGLKLSVVPAGSTWEASFSSGPIAITATTEANLRKYLLGFDLKPSQAKAVRVTIESLDASMAPTGSRQKTVYPPVANAFYRYTFDLGEMVAGSPDFQTGGNHIRLTFTLVGDGTATSWLAQGTPTLVVDNVSLVTPKYYVGNLVPGASDTSNDGLSEATPFRSIQRAVDLAVAGDVIHVMNGTYDTGFATTVQINKRGAPDKWIVLRSNPGHQPVIRNRVWQALQISRPAAYIEVRELKFLGYYPETQAEFDEKLAAAQAEAPFRSRRKSDGALSMEKADGTIYESFPGTPMYQTNGVSVSGRAGSTNQAEGIHDIRIIRNEVSDFPGGGIGASQTDRFTVEGNYVSRTSYFSRYGNSGITILHGWNFTRTTEHKLFFINNISHSNRVNVICTVYYYNGDAIKSPAPTLVTDGNGIILDVSRTPFLKTDAEGNTYSGPDYYTGTTLVQNNLCYNNGGGGIVTTSYSYVDVVNNTLYKNVTHPDTIADGWGELFFGGSDRSSNIRANNNIVWASYGVRTVTVLAGSPLANNIYLENNLFFGDGNNTAHPSRDANGNVVTGPTTNFFADPQFVNPSINPAVADFRLKASSQAIDKGVSYGLLPLIDLEGNRRPFGSASDVGAYEVTGTLPGARAASSVSVTTSNSSVDAGIPVTLTATVTGSNGVPSGSVAFIDGGTVLLGSVPVNASGVATLVTSTLTVGTHTIVASYSGDLSHAPSVSSGLTQTIVGLPNTQVWTGAGTNNVYGNTANWSGGVIPGASDKALFRNAVNTQIVLNNDHTFATMDFATNQVGSVTFTPRTGGTPKLTAGASGASVSILNTVTHAPTITFNTDFNLSPARPSSAAFTFNNNGIGANLVLNGKVANAISSKDLTHTVFLRGPGASYQPSTITFNGPSPTSSTARPIEGSRS